MLLFRSEEHVEAWLAGHARGAVISVGTLAALADAWWGDRLVEGWRPQAREQKVATLDRLGLTDPFWRLP